MNEQRPLLEGYERRNEDTRRRLRRLLESKYGHYAVLMLVSLDVSSIFVEFILQLLVCDGNLAREIGRQGSEVLSVIGLIFSSLFMIELAVSIYAFGKKFFTSWFHCFDATVILASFIVDLATRGIESEVGSLLIVLRLWRVFKIIEELSEGAAESTAGLYDQIDELKSQNDLLETEVNNLRRRLAQ